MVEGEVQLLVGALILSKGLGTNPGKGSIMHNRTKLKTVLAAVTVAPLVLLGSACSSGQAPAPVTQTVTAPPAASAPITPPTSLFPPDTADGDRVPQQKQAPQQQAPQQGTQQERESKKDQVDKVMISVAEEEGIRLEPGEGYAYASASCKSIDQGISIMNVIEGAAQALPEWGLTFEDHAYLVGASIGSLCPEYSDLPLE